NLSISNNGETQQQLLKKMVRGVLVAESRGPGVYLVTGGYSRGVVGFWVGYGEMEYPVEGFTLASHLGDMFRQLAGAGTDVDDRGNIRVGSLLIEQMNIAGR